MGRLTKRPKDVTIGGLLFYGGVQTAAWDITGADIISRLADFEDILFDADGNEIVTLDHLREMVQAEKDGRLVVRPKPEFNEGDLVRVVDAADHGWIGRTAKIKSVYLHSDGLISYRLDIGGGYWLQSMLASAEAEAALEAQKGGVL